MTAERWIAQAEARLQEEIGAQGRMLARLREQERAIGASDLDGLRQSTAAMEAELSAERGRLAALDRIAGGLARELGVDARAPSLGRAVEALGARGERLGRLREETRSRALEVRALARRIVVAARFHADLSREIVRALAGEAGAGEPDGTLVRAEA